MDLKGNAVTWLGHGTWLWETSEGKRLLIDAWITGNPSTPDEFKDLAALKLDGILLTHGHFDHIGQGGAEAVAVIKANPDAPVFALFELAAYLGGKGVEVNGFNKGGTIEVAGVKATLVTAHHSGGITDDDGTIVEGGDPAGYMLEFPDGLVVYQAGDTDVFGDMALLGEIYRPDRERAADRRLLHDGSASGGPRRAPDRLHQRDLGALRDVPAPRRAPCRAAPAGRRGRGPHPRHPPRGPAQLLATLGSYVAAPRAVSARSAARAPLTTEATKLPSIGSRAMMPR